LTRKLLIVNYCLMCCVGASACLHVLWTLLTLATHFNLQLSLVVVFSIVAYGASLFLALNQTKTFWMSSFAASLLLAIIVLVSTSLLEFAGGTQKFLLVAYLLLSHLSLLKLRDD
jgi:hypothetical protein